MENIRAADNVSSNAKSCTYWFISGEKGLIYLKLKKCIQLGGNWIIENGNQSWRNVCAIRLSDDW